MEEIPKGELVSLALVILLIGVDLGDRSRNYELFVQASYFETGIKDEWKD